MFVKTPPVSHLNIICNAIIHQMVCMKLTDTSTVQSDDLVKFRDLIYDILIYNLEVSNCIWFIFNYYINNKLFQEKKIDFILDKIIIFFKEYGNNYRAIFHIENLLFLFICSSSTTTTTAINIGT